MEGQNSTAFQEHLDFQTAETKYTTELASIELKKLFDRAQRTKICSPVINKSSPLIFSRMYVLKMNLRVPKRIRIT